MVKKVHVVGNVYSQQTAAIFAKMPEDFEVVKDFKDADIYVFTGGEDIDPAIYNDKRLSVSQFNRHRDEYELDAHGHIEKDKIKIGICRGAQLLNCLNGGQLWQDVNNHWGGHHEIVINVKGITPTNTATINSIHHQMMIAGPKAETLAVAYESTYRVKGDREVRGTIFTDNEVLWYPDTKSFCFQAHPEFGHPETTDIFFKMLKHVGVY